MESESNSNNHDFTNALSHSNNSLNLTPVAPEQSGNGLPYAPENFPNSGDIWRWRTGKRVAANGNFRDRYLYLPPRLIAAGHSSGRGGFASKLSVERFLKESFPDIDVLDFFAKFSWTIPSTLPSGLFLRSVLILFLNASLFVLIDAVCLILKMKYVRVC